MDWLSKLREGYYMQRNIGWEQVMYDRIASVWESLSQEGLQEVHDGQKFTWTGSGPSGYSGALD